MLPRTWVTPRQIVMLALVVAIGALSACSGQGDDPAETLLGEAEASLKVEVGEPVPDFTLATPDGRQLRLSDFAGQTVVLSFWATWCAPCRVEMPDLQQAYEERLAAGDFVVLAVNLQESESQVNAFFEEFGLTFPVVIDESGKVAEQFGLIGLPGTFFIDANQVLRSRMLGPVVGDLLADGIAAADGAERATS